MKAFFISDVHQKLLIDDRERQKLHKLYQFLNYVYQERADYLFLVGDIFDLWFEYKMVIPKPYFQTIQKLFRISENGTKLVFLAGNHDFLFRDFFQKYMNAEIYFDNCQIEIDNKRIFISHGDEYTVNDSRYHILRAILHNKFLISIFELVHPDIGLAIGRAMSRSSRARKIPAKLQRKREIGLENFAKKKIHQLADGVDLLVMGHTHNPKVIKYEQGVYVNLGDWITHFSYLEFIDGKFELKKW